MKNAFEKIGAITDKDGKNFEILLTSKHAGTLASISNDNVLIYDFTQCMYCC
ncbi:hypothetical protein FLA4_04680 [Candidatus Rickettsia kotlanii]|nr:hypothetical protein FLA4_04680 [Candidatus Rickettsia kotlanii]BDU61301.1 hypothetical protein HM2_04690 [Candidatus Rickettsia kotlanii]